MGVQGETYIEVPFQVPDTVQWVVKDAEHYDALTDAQRTRIQEWLVANDIDPHDVVGREPVSVTTSHYPVGGTGSVIRFTQYVRDAEGHHVTNWPPHEIVTMPRAVQQRVPFGDPC